MVSSDAEKWYDVETVYHLNYIVIIVAEVRNVKKKKKLYTSTIQPKDKKNQTNSFIFLYLTQLILHIRSGGHYLASIRLNSILNNNLQGNLNLEIKLYSKLYPINT